MHKRRHAAAIFVRSQTTYIFMEQAEGVKSTLDFDTFLDDIRHHYFIKNLESNLRSSVLLEATSTHTRHTEETKVCTMTDLFY